MPAPPLFCTMTETFKKIAVLIALLLASESALAGVVVGGTRFVFPATREALTVSLTNTSKEPWLINSKINLATRWPGGSNYRGPIPLLPAPPLFLLQPGATGTLRLMKTGETMPADRENLFELSIASVPSGRVENQSVKVAMRSVFKLFWRPQGLPGDPLEAWQQLTLTMTSQGVQLHNPTPYYINLTQVAVNGVPVNDAGVVAPKSQRQTDWCHAASRCQISWRSINDYGGFSVKKVQNLP